MGSKITTIKDLAAEHPYYCSQVNYYSNEAGRSWETWGEFYDEFGDADIDYNMVFRWDVRVYIADDEPPADKLGKYRMEVFIMHQRKGLFAPHFIEVVTDADVESIVEYLSKHWAQMIDLWQPLSNNQK